MAKMRVLIIDDELDFATVLRDRLTFEGFEVDIASDGRTGLERLQTSPPDLIILDIMMPTMDGFTFLRRVRAEKGAAMPAILIVTAYGREPTDEERGLMGDIPIVRKPFDVESLLRKVRRLTSQA